MYVCVFLCVQPGISGMGCCIRCIPAEDLIILHWPKEKLSISPSINHSYDDNAMVRVGFSLKLGFRCGMSFPKGGCDLLSYHNYKEAISCGDVVFWYATIVRSR